MEEMQRELTSLTGNCGTPSERETNYDRRWASGVKQQTGRRAA